ncbi:hypothetical protein [Haloferax profundi]|uniref:hypothetical protein n=1 Tax=Haloferax profundi TaxID=1544718 RepID=UPI000AF32B84|nr:hypothetical protein [Haloferax profundi]
MVASNSLGSRTGGGDGFTYYETIGGGYGDPSDRTTEAIERDVAEEKMDWSTVT